jgi:hypothetical protein
MSFNLSDDLLKLVSSQKQKNVICERVQLMPKLILFHKRTSPIKGCNKKKPKLVSFHKQTSPIKGWDTKNFLNLKFKSPKKLQQKMAEKILVFAQIVFEIEIGDSKRLKAKFSY